MRRIQGLILWLVYAAVLASCAAKAQAAEVMSFGEWFWGGSGLDWLTAAGSIATAMLGGALRTMITLLSRVPTFRVALQAVADAVVSALAGIPCFIALQVMAVAGYWQPSHDVRFALLFAAGMVGRTFFRRLDQGLKDGMSIAVEGAKAKLARSLGLPEPQPLPPETTEPEPPTVVPRHPADEMPAQPENIR